MSVASAALGAALNILVFGAIIYGALKSRQHGWSLIGWSLGVPSFFNIAVVLFKHQLTLQERFIGLLVTLLVAVVFGYLLCMEKMARVTANG